MGGSWKGLGSSSGALGDVLGSGDLDYPNISISDMQNTVKPALANEREARAVGNHEDMR